jgi:hypothetical protein
LCNMDRFIATTLTSGAKANTVHLSVYEPI